jgi:small subunit ribosomal protein S20
MPNTKSAKKRLRQNIERRGRNRAAKGSLRTQLRKVREAAEAGDTNLAEQQYRAAAKYLDRAAAHRLIHPNKAARTKSRLQALIKRAKQSSTEA